MKALPGTKTLLMGDAGTGKTFAIKSAVDWCKANGNRQVFCLFTEQGLETLVGAYTDFNQPIPDNLHWHVLDMKPIKLASLMKTAENAGKMSYEAMTKMVDATRHETNVFLEILSILSDFPDDRTGQKFGAVDAWDNSRHLFIDGLTQLSNAAMKMIVGAKPTASQPDYGVAQNNLMNLLNLLTQATECHVALLAHCMRDRDETSGTVKLMPSAVGVALSPQIPPLFSDCIFTVREGDKWYWDTINTQAVVKTRSLQVAARLLPNFSAIYDKWLKREAASRTMNSADRQPASTT